MNAKRPAMKAHSHLRLAPLRGSEGCSVFRDAGTWLFRQRRRAPSDTGADAVVPRSAPQAGPVGVLAGMGRRHGPLVFALTSSHQTVTVWLRSPTAPFLPTKGRGYAKSIIAALFALAVRSGASTVFAHTLAENNPSNSALRREGFSFVGEVMDSEDGLVWRWEKSA